MDFRKELAFLIGRSYASLVNSESFLGLDRIRARVNARTIIFSRQEAIEILKAAGLLPDRFLSEL